MTIKHLPPITIEGHQLTSSGTPDHPMRVATRRAAGIDEGGWTGDLRDEVAKYFDDYAQEWHTRTSPERNLIVADALKRGLGELGTPQGFAVEVGSGIGAYSALIAEHFAPVMAIDLSIEMLKLAPEGPAHRVLGDGSKLPVRDGSAAAVVLINCFLFPDEVARVLTPDGVLVWVNSSAEKTPIHLSVEDVCSRLPGNWNTVTSRAGLGLWCALRRATHEAR
ncbi:MAG TPA: class I SAM-dependent methyltransferase [Candidatus Krumholzibacteria bacterium]|nr:class I SAM-dependent methyltransferase [Candidatus Krumholzibacteria bacterium]